MNFPDYLQQRDVLLREARLANYAYACERLLDCAARLGRAGLFGPLALQPADPESERLFPALIALAENQSVVDEHFLDEDIADLVDVFEFLAAQGMSVPWTFTLEEIEEHVLPQLRRELARAGIAAPVRPSHAARLRRPRE